MDEDLPPGWAWATLGEIAEGAASVSPACVFKDEDSFLYVDLSAVVGGRIIKPQTLKPRDAPSRARQKVRSGDTLFSGVRVYLENIAFVTSDFDGQIASTAFSVLRPRPGIDPRYLYWLTRQPTFIKAMVEAQRGNSPPAVQDEDVRRAAIPIAPSAQQARIAAEIDALFDELDEAEAALARAREGVGRFRASLLHAACTGQLTAAWRAANPPGETGADLLARILAERRAAWERTERARLEARGTPPRGDAWKARYEAPAPPDLTDLPELPEGWVWASIEQLGPISTGTTPSRADRSLYEGGTIPWVTSSAVNAKSVTAASEYVTPKALDSTSLRINPVGSILIALYGEGKTRGKAAVLNIAACTNQALAVVRTEAIKPATRDYVLMCLERAYLQLRSQAAGGVQPNLNLSMLKSWAIPLPPLTEQIKILTVIDEEEIFDDLFDASSISALRQSILHAAFTGRLVPQDEQNEPASALLARLRAANPTPAPKGSLTRRVRRAT